MAGRTAGVKRLLDTGVADEELLAKKTWGGEPRLASQ